MSTANNISTSKSPLWGRGGLSLAFRNLRRNALYSWINIIGLAVSLTVAILILLWVQDELGRDRFHEHADNIYLYYNHSRFDGQEVYGSYTEAPRGRTAKEKIAGVEEGCAIGKNYDMGYLEYSGNKFFGGKYYIADTGIFRVFTATFTEGSPSHAFNDPYSIAITDKLATFFFGNEPALGKMLTASSGKPYTVSAVVKSMPKNSTLQFDAIFSFEQSRHKDNWNMSAFQTYLLLKPGVDPNSLGQQLMELRPDAKAEDGWLPAVLQPLREVGLYDGDGKPTGIKSVILLTTAAVVMLIIACINYVNLVTARAAKRRKEISLRKLLGARKYQLFLQMMSEAVLLFVIALGVATALIYLLIPFYNELVGKQLSFNLFNPQVLLIYLSTFVLVVALAGIYPSIMLSSFNPKDALHPASGGRTRVFSFRKILVILQFVCSAAFIFGTIVINRQLHYMREQSVGYMQDPVFTIDIFRNKNMRDHYQSLKADLLQQSCITGVSGSEQNIIDVGNFAGGIRWEGMPEGRQFTIANCGVDTDLLPMLNMQLVEGEGFSGTPADSSRYILNETAVKKMGMNNPIGKWFDMGYGKGIVAGVVRDFCFRHISEETPPIVMRLPDTYWTIYIKPARGKISEAIAVTEKMWRKHEPDYPFKYQFMDETFSKMHEAELRTGRLFNVFAIISILISCLGLFGLVTYTAETKTKEIGIRKVLGASVGGLVEMLSKEFLVLVGVAMVIAFPLAYYWLHSMLQDYAYRISISWWMFGLAALVTVMLTLLTVAGQALKAARANPVKSIKTE